jgi:hypothetical protein
VGHVLKRHKDLACRRVSKHHRGFATPRGGKLTDSTPKENVFRIAIKNGVVRYYRNGARIYQSLIAPGCPLSAAALTINLNATVTDAVIVATPTN